jgi:transposase-like protein
MEKTTIKEKAKRYQETFKENAVQLTMRPGAKLKVIAHDLGVSAVTLRGWRDRMVGSAAAPAGLRPEDLAQRLRETENRLALVTEERDILKKACGILSTPSRGGMHK